MATTEHPTLDSLGDRIKPTIMGHALSSFRSMLSGPGVDADHDFVRLVTGEPNAFANFVCMAHGLDQARVMDLADPLMRCGAPSAVLFCGAVGEGATEELVGSGFKEVGGLTAMAIDIATVGDSALPPGYRFTRANGPQDRDGWADSFARAYGLPPRATLAFAGALGTQSAGDASIQYFWILKGDEPVCTSVLCTDGGIAGIFDVATMAHERGKGLGAFATAEPLRLARAHGYRVGVLHATQDGYPVYRRIGFNDCGGMPLFVRTPG